MPASASIVGLGSVTLSVRDLAGTADFLTQVLGFRANEKDAHLFETGPGGVGARLHLEGALHRGFEGAGGVHHVAWRVKKPEDLLAWQTQLENHGYRTSGPVDRHYFRSLYFRIPSGILFEIATDGPGFTSDGEPLDHLGETLALPPFLEAHRSRIEAGVKPLIYQP